MNTQPNRFHATRKAWARLKRADRRQAKLEKRARIASAKKDAFRHERRFAV